MKWQSSTVGDHSTIHHPNLYQAPQGRSIAVRVEGGGAQESHLTRVFNVGEGALGASFMPCKGTSSSGAALTSVFHAPRGSARRDVRSYECLLTPCGRFRAEGQARVGVFHISQGTVRRDGSSCKRFTDIARHQAPRRYLLWVCSAPYKELRRRRGSSCD